MKSSELRIPLYAKFSLLLISASLLLGLLYVAQHIIIPLLLALIFAILLRPFVVFLNRRLRFPHVIAALVAVTVAVLFVVTVIFFVSWQVSGIANDWAKIKINLSLHLAHIQTWIQERFHMSMNTQQEYIDKVKTEGIGENSNFMGNTLNSFTDTLVNAMLIPIYTFLILLYRNLFIRFLGKLVSRGNEYILADVLMEVKVVIQSYVVGLMIETGIVAVLTTGGLMLLGVPYALLLGVITGILNLIPYIGILIAALITILATLIDSADLSTMFAVIGLSILVQFIDNNLLVPRIVGNKVRINALASMLGVVIGGFIAGIAGMFLAIPLIAMLKVIFDRIQPLAPFGYIMGDDISKTYTWGKIQLPDFSLGNNNEPWPAQQRKSRVESTPDEDKKA